MTTTFPCLRVPHNRALPPMPPCALCGINGPRVVLECACCAATCDVVACDEEHRRVPSILGGTRIEPRTIDLCHVDGAACCDDCAMDCPPIGGYPVRHFRQIPPPAPAGRPLTGRRRPRKPAVPAIEPGEQGRLFA